MGTEDVKVTATNMYKYKERLRLYKYPQMFKIRIVALLCAKKISNLRNKKNLCISSTFL